LKTKEIQDTKVAIKEIKIPNNKKKSTAFKWVFE
jgi:hypothetical protein